VLDKALEKTRALDDRGLNYNLLLQVDQTATGAILKCLPCFGVSVTGNPSGCYVISEESTWTLTSFVKHLKDPGHKQRAGSFLKTNMAAGNLALRSASGRVGSFRSLSAILEEDGGFARYCNSIVYFSLQTEGQLFQLCLGQLPQTTVHREAAVMKQRPHLVRLLLGLAVLSLEETNNENVAALSKYVFCVPPVEGTKIVAKLLLKVPTVEDGQQAMTAFIASLTKAFGVLKIRCVNRPPSVMCFTNADHFKQQTVLSYAQSQKFMFWLTGLAARNNGDGDDDNDDMFAGPGERASVGQEYNVIAKSMRNMLYSLKMLCLAGCADRTDTVLPTALSNWFFNQDKELRVEVGGSIKAPSAVRALQLQHHLGSLMDLAVCLKKQFHDAAFFLQDLMGALGRRIVAEEKRFREQHAGMLNDQHFSEFLLSQIVKPVLLEPAISEILHLSFVCKAPALWLSSRVVASAWKYSDTKRGREIGNVQAQGIAFMERDG
jgi:hypothetical protein